MGRARLPAQRPVSSDQSCRPSWCKAAVSDVPTRCHQRASEKQGAGNPVPRGNHVQAPGGARPVHQPQVSVSGSSVFKGIGVFLSVFFKVIFIGFTCFTILCLYCTAERVSSAFTYALCSGFPSQLGYHRALGISRAGQEVLISRLSDILWIARACQPPPRSPGRHPFPLGIPVCSGPGFHIHSLWQCCGLIWKVGSEVSF